MLVGLVFTSAYIIYFKFINPGANSKENWLLGVSPEGIGTLGMAINFFVSLSVSYLTQPPPAEIVELVYRIRQPGNPLTYDGLDTTLDH